MNTDRETESYADFDFRPISHKVRLTDLEFDGSGSAIGIAKRAVAGLASISKRADLGFNLIGAPVMHEMHDTKEAVYYVATTRLEGRDGVSVSSSTGSRRADLWTNFSFYRSESGRIEPIGACDYSGMTFKLDVWSDADHEWTRFEGDIYEAESLRGVFSEIQNRFVLDFAFRELFNSSGFHEE